MDIDKLIETLDELEQEDTRDVFVSKRTLREIRTALLEQQEALKQQPNAHLVHGTEHEHTEQEGAGVAPPALELKYRYALFRFHPHDMKYGDDGEMQCNHWLCLIDFRRDPLPELERKLAEFDLRRAAEILNATPAGPRDALQTASQSNKQNGGE